MSTPVLSQLTLKPQGFRIEESSLVPNRLPDLFSGVPVTIRGRYHGYSPQAIFIEAVQPDGKSWKQQEFAWQGHTPGLTTIWARQRLHDLGNAYAITQSSELENDLVQLSLEHQVLCPFTAYVAIDTTQVANRHGKWHTMTQPVEMPSGWTQRRELHSSETQANLHTTVSVADKADYFIDEIDGLVVDPGIIHAD